MKLIKDYEPVIGLEVHVELNTKTKLLCSCPTVFGAEPNTQCCPVCMGMPGKLPVLNETAVEYAIIAGIATDCRISRRSRFDRKNYFYPDLPKAFQTTQADYPFCLGGHLDISTTSGEKRIGITRIHLEEDAGKLIHDGERGTLIDFNRCGVPLIEIVSEPDMRSSEEAVEYVRRLRSVITYTGISDCRMNEGSLRCDVNLSVRRRGDTALGVRTEMKNINSFAFIQKAIEYEYARQVALLEKGEPVLRETRRFDSERGITVSLRSKESAADYRFFPEPDIPPVILSEERIAELALRVPELPDQRKKRYTGALCLPEHLASPLVADKTVSDYFDRAAALAVSPETVASLTVSELFRLLPDEITEIPLPPERLAEIADMLSQGEINFSVAKRTLFLRGVEPRRFVEENGLTQLRDRSALTSVASSVIADNPKPVSDYRAGKSAAFKSLMGLCMKATGGRADAELLSQLLRSLLDG